MNLKTFSLQSWSFNKPLDNLPITLEVLQISADVLYTHNLLNLPQTLKKLELHFTGDETFRIDFPPMLEEIAISFDIDLNNIQKNVKFLSIFSSNKQPINTFPESFNKSKKY